jgi:hypothetical protein
MHAVLSPLHIMSLVPSTDTQLQQYTNRLLAAIRRYSFLYRSPSWSEYARARRRRKSRSKKGSLRVRDAHLGRPRRPATSRKKASSCSCSCRAKAAATRRSASGSRRPAGRTAHTAASATSQQPRPSRAAEAPLYPPTKRQRDDARVDEKRKLPQAHANAVTNPAP